LQSKTYSNFIYQVYIPLTSKDLEATMRPGAISDFITCVNANHYTECGVVTDVFDLKNSSDAVCEPESGKTKNG
jgi:hypothetical protein